ncbi:MAG: hypothetical protein ACJ71Q_13815 [Terriglobales bacterium]
MGYMLLFLMLAFPMVPAVMYAKVAFFGILVVACLFGGLLHKNVWLDARIIILTVGFAAAGCLFAIRGLLLGTPGATKCAQIYVFWPLIYSILLIGASGRKVLTRLRWVLIAATVFIGIQGTLFALASISVLPANNLARLFSVGWQEQSIGFHEGYIGIQFPGLNSLPFLIPFVIAALATHRLRDSETGVVRFWLWAALIAGLAVLVVSSRRGVIVTTLAAPLLTGFLLLFRPAAERRLGIRILARISFVIVVFAALIIASFNSVYRFSVTDLAARVFQGFDFSRTTVDEGSLAREEQFTALVHGWYEHPIVGAGLGAKAADSIRSDERPWEYELYYLALLYQTGLLGLLAYVGGIAWIFWQGVKIIKSDRQKGYLVLPILVGSACLLLANATNPYLPRFDGLWAIFLPLAHVNSWLVRQKVSASFAATRQRPTLRLTLLRRDRAKPLSAAFSRG